MRFVILGCAMVGAAVGNIVTESYPFFLCRGNMCNVIFLGYGRNVHFGRLTILWHILEENELWFRFELEREPSFSNFEQNFMPNGYLNVNSNELHGWMESSTDPMTVSTKKRHGMFATSSSKIVDIVIYSNNGYSTTQSDSRLRSLWRRMTS